jgi:hypothetical protein
MLPPIFAGRMGDDRSRASFQPAFPEAEFSTQNAAVPRGPRISVRVHPETHEREADMSRQNLTQKSADPAPHATVQRDAIRVLTEDHRAVQKLFDAFEKVSKDELEAKATLVRRACEELTIHAMIDEELLYPAAEQALDEKDRPRRREGLRRALPRKSVDR